MWLPHIYNISFTKHFSLVTNYMPYLESISKIGASQCLLNRFINLSFQGAQKHVFKYIYFWAQDSYRKLTQPLLLLDIDHQSELNVYNHMALSTQMEICQTGYYTEDFRTQEVPAGFDFASYGEFRESLDSLEVKQPFFFFLPVRVRDFISVLRQIQGQSCLCDLFPLNLSSWRTEEIFSQTVSSHLSEIFSVRPWN